MNVISNSELFLVPIGLLLLLYIGSKLLPHDSVLSINHNIGLFGFNMSKSIVTAYFGSS